MVKLTGNHVLRTHSKDRKRDFFLTTTIKEEFNPIIFKKRFPKIILIKSTIYILPIVL